MKIKRCPFCGSKADLLQQYNDKLGIYFLRVECRICGARSGTTSTKEDARKSNWEENKHCEKVVAFWNNRIPIEVAKKWARDWIRAVDFKEDGSCKYDSNDKKNFIMIGDLDDIFDFIYDEEEAEEYYGKLV